MASRAGVSPRQSTSSSRPATRPRTSPPAPAPTPVLEYAVVPPDGGWGWIVVAAAFYCNTVIDGILFSFGMYLSGIVATYNTDHAYVALIGSLMYGIHLGAGPLCAALTKSFGFRPMVFVGSIMTAGALASASLHPPLWALTILFGFVAGIGMCFVYMSSITVTAMYFSRFRILAVGIVVCGTGAGTVIFSQAGNYMLKSMTWEEAHLILSFCALLMALAGLCFRPLEPLRITTTPTVPPQRLLSMLSQTSLWGGDDDDSTVVLVTKSRTHSLASAMDATHVALGTYASGLLIDRNFFRDRMGRCCGKWFSCFKPTAKVHERFLDETIEETPDTLALGLGSVAMFYLHGRRLTQSWIGKKFLPQSGSRWAKIKNSFAHMDWEILKIPSFALFCATGALTSTGLIMVFTFENSRILAEGFSRDTATAFVTTLGAANMFWRLFLGSITLFPHVNYHALNVVGHFLGGTAIIASSFANSVGVYFMYCFVLGLGLGSFAVFRPVLLLELVGMEKLSNATGISLLFTGLFAIAGPPLGGWIYAMTGNYQAIYWISGSLFIFSGFLLIFITGGSPRIVEQLNAALPAEVITQQGSVPLNT